MDNWFRGGSSFDTSLSGLEAARAVCRPTVQCKASVRREKSREKWGRSRSEGSHYSRLSCKYIPSSALLSSQTLYSSSSLQMTPWMSIKGGEKTAKAARVEDRARDLAGVLTLCYQSRLSLSLLYAFTYTLAL